MQDVLSSHPVTIALALIAAVVWWMGNTRRSKVLQILGILLTVAAMIAYLF